MREFLRKHKWLLGIELACILFCLAACFRPEETVFSAEAGEIADMLQTGEDGSYYRSGDITLLPGVYVLGVVCGDHQGTLFSNVQAWESSFQALRSNGGAVYAHQREADLELYVTEKVDRAYVICNYINETEQPIERILLRRTSAGWRMLLFLVLLAATGLNLLLWFREGILSGRVGKDREIVFWTLSASVLLAYLPYAVDYFYVGADGWTQLQRIEELKESPLQGGQLFLLLPALLRVIGFPLMDAYRFFVAAVLAGTALLSYHCFYRCSGNRYGALAGSVLYELAPYHIYCLYNQSAVEEYLGMMFLPLVVWGIYRLYTEDVKSTSYGRAKIPLAVGMGCLLQSQVSGCCMTAVGVAAACLIMWRKTFRRETLLELGKTVLWCLGLSAWFWVRLLQMLWADQYVLSAAAPRNIQHMGIGLAQLLQIYPYMGGARTGVYNGEPIQAGAAFWAVFLCYVVLRLGRRGKEDTNPWDKIMRGCLLFGLLSLFLSTRYFPWDVLAAIPVLGTLTIALQSPVRLLAAAALFSALAAAFFAVWLTEERKRWSARTGRGIAACCAVCIAVAALSSALFQVDELAWNSQPVRLYTAGNIGSASVAGGEYLPYQVFPLSWCGELVSWLTLAALILGWILQRRAGRKEAQRGAEM